MTWISTNDFWYVLVPILSIAIPFATIITLSDRIDSYIWNRESKKRNES